MNDNPNITDSPFLSKGSGENGESFRFPFHPSRRDGFKFRLPKSICFVLIFIICAALLGHFLKTSSFPGLIPLILALWAILGLWRGSSQVDPTEILIDPIELKFPPSGTNVIAFSDVRVYEESVSHIDIYHEQISGLTKFRLLRHEFQATDWDRLGPILQDRVRFNTPDARIHTPLDPPDRRLFRTDSSDKW